MKKTMFAFLFSMLGIKCYPVEIGQPAPKFTTKNQDGKDFSLADRQNQGWTVLFFYPKAETPGCTKQACAFRDAISKVEVDKTKVYGISVNTPEEQKAFQTHHKLNFELLSDDGKICEMYGTKMPLLSMSKRWTFIIDDQLVIRSIDRDVDPAKDAIKVAEKIKELKKSLAPNKSSASPTP